MVPCFHVENQLVLVNAVLYQLGAKRIRAKPWETHTLNAASSRVCSLTMWKNEWNEKEWNNALTKTGPHIREVIANCGLDGSFETMWGRSLRRGKQVASVHEATSIQVHISVPEAKFQSCLAASGFNRLWIVPEAEGGGIADDYSPVAPASRILNLIFRKSTHLPPS